MRGCLVELKSILSVGLAGLLVIQTGLPSTVWAQAPVSSSDSLQLPALIAELKAKNPSLREARTRWEAAQARIPLTKGLPAPRIGIEFEEIPKGGIKINQATVMYQLLQSLPFPGKLSARHRVAVAEAQVAASVFKQTEWDLVTQLKTAYYDVWLLDRESEVAREQVIWVTQAVTAAQARYATGEGAQADLLRWQAAALETANDVEVLLNRRAAAAAHLNHLLTRPSHEPIGPLADIPLQPLAATPDELWLLAQAQQPDLLVMRYSVERAEAAWRLQKRELWPDLETMAELRNPAMGPIGPWDLTLAIVLPFWFWTKQRYGVKAALYDKHSMEAAYEAMQLDVTRRIHEHWHEAVASWSTAQLTRDGLIPLARQTVTSLMAGYHGGRSSALELLEALRALAERQRTYAQQLVSLEQHVVMLEQAVGVSLREAHETQLVTSD